MNLSLQAECEQHKKAAHELAKVARTAKQEVCALCMAGSFCTACSYCRARSSSTGHLMSWCAHTKHALVLHVTSPLCIWIMWSSNLPFFYTG